MTEAFRVLTVSELNAYVQRTLAVDPMLQGLRLRGEISNCKRHTSGHWYFSMKDEAARIQCVLFRAQAQMLAVTPADGLRVIAQGRAALYPKDGQYQFYVDRLQPDGVGALYLQFEALKQALRAEGLFDAARKRPLPLLPRGVGIVTSPTGAVIRDIQQVARRRWPAVPLVLCPVKVQGEGAAREVAQGIDLLGRRSGIDVIIVGRGGGSLEELWAFNEEIVARAIAACPKPVVSAVGHETDVTIADFAADLRAPTPSAAAELVVPDAEALREQIADRLRRLDRAFHTNTRRLRDRVDALRKRLDAGRPDRLIVQRRQRVGDLAGRLQRAARGTLALHGQRLSALTGRLNALGPQQVLGRGYALVLDRQGGLIASAAQANPGDALRIRLRDGALAAQVTARMGES